MICNKIAGLLLCIVGLTGTMVAQTNTFPASGNVGIGTTGPLSPLSVSGQVIIGNPYRGDASLHITQSYGGFGRLTQIVPSGNSQNALNIMASTDSSGNGDWWSWGVNSNTWSIQPGACFGCNGSTGFFVNPFGNVGIGTTAPAYSLDVAGVARAQQGVIYPDGNKQTTAWTGVLCGGDYAEDMRANGGKARYEPGDVLVLTEDGKQDVAMSSQPYSTMVAGIYATKPGVVGRRDLVAQSTENIPMAMIGVVPTKVSAENGPIHRGDLLVTSSTNGYAMKGTDRNRMLGAVIGKAMGSLDTGTGVIEVLVTLQ